MALPSVYQFLRLGHQQVGSSTQQSEKVSQMTKTISHQEPSTKLQKFGPNATNPLRLERKAAPIYGFSVILLALASCASAPDLSGVINSGVVCQTEPDCALGQACDGGFCTTSNDPDIQYLADSDGIIAPVEEGGTVPVYRGFQGGQHTYLTIRATGFESESAATLDVQMVLVEDGSNAIDPQTLEIVFSEIEPGVTEAAEIFVRTTGFASGQLHRKDAIVTITVTDVVDPSITASVEQTVFLFESGLP